MPKNYIYRTDHDTGFAPNIKYGICTLCGCKKTVIEKHAEKGSWVIGIGGNSTGKPNKVIYAMEVEDTPSYSKFKKEYPGKSKYLKGKCKLKAPVLISRKFYYFGENAFCLPNNLKHIIIYQQGCKCVSDEDIAKLTKHILSKWPGYGIHGNPNNSTRKPLKKCGKKLKSPPKTSTPKKC
jgi:hypothetical protein